MNTCKRGDREDDRPVPFDESAYRKRSIVEPLIGWLKESRRIAFIHRYLRLSAT